MKYSIIVPVYKVEDYLEQCICSILNQSFHDFELILVDDGSPDNCSVICDSWSQKDERIIVIHKDNGGLSSARNEGIRISQGDYILFLDSDDYWKGKDVLEQIDEKLRLYHPDVLSFNFLKTDGISYDKPYFKANSDEKSGFQLSHDVWIACAWNKVIKRELFQYNNLFFIEGITSEDIDWCIRLAIVANSFAYLDDVVVCYRQRESSISNSMTLKKTQCLYENVKRCIHLVENECHDKDKKDELTKYIAYQFGTLLYSIAMLDHADDRKFLIQEVQKHEYLLANSNNKKIQLLYLVEKLGGLRLVILLLRIKNSIK